jgi:putative Flp pilus-assembly TadE/G-like protein
MGPRPSRGYARRRVRREDGQFLPGLVILMLAIVGLGVLGFQIGKAAILRSEAQTAADAAALAGAREIKRQLEVQWATFGTTDVTAIDTAAVVAQMADYARRNGGRLDPDRPPQINGADVKAWVETEEDLGEDARELDREQTRGEARARARLSLMLPGYNAGAGIPIPGGGSPRIGDDEWDALAKRISKPPVCRDVVTLGLFLKSHGFMVWQNAHPELGGDPGHSYNPSSWHLKCGGMGAIDVNFGPACGDLCPIETRAIDPLIEPLQKLGFFTIWRAEGHYDHLHVDPSRSGLVGAGGATGGFTGALEDVGLDVELIDWEAPVEELFGFGAGGNYGGPPDLKIVALMCRMAEPYGPKILLAAFETAIVESGIHNLRYGDADSHGVFQQQYTQGWGTLADTMNPPKATQMFLDAAVAVNRRYPHLSAGQLAAQVQRPLESLRGRYEQVKGQAQALIAEHC